MWPQGGKRRDGGTQGSTLGCSEAQRRRTLARRALGRPEAGTWVLEGGEWVLGRAWFAQVLFWVFGPQELLQALGSLFMVGECGEEVGMVRMDLSGMLALMKERRQ